MKCQPYAIDTKRWAGVLESVFGPLSIEGQEDPKSQEWVIARLGFALPESVQNFGQRLPPAPLAKILEQVLSHPEENHQDLLRPQGTEFEKSVWNVLSTIPLGQVASYQWVAGKIGMPKAFRAVGQAVGKNPIAIAIPCHRVVRLNGDLGGYKWGKDIKIKILLHEKVDLKTGKNNVVKINALSTPLW